MVRASIALQVAGVAEARQIPTTQVDGDAGSGVIVQEVTQGGEERGIVVDQAGIAGDEVYEDVGDVGV